MIDEKARQWAKQASYLSKSAIHEIKSTLDCLVTVYFDRVRWIEMSGFVGTGAISAKLFMAYVGAAHYGVAASLFVGVLIAITYLRNPKMANWQGTPTVEQCEKDKECSDAP